MPLLLALPSTIRSLSHGLRLATCALVIIRHPVAYPVTEAVHSQVGSPDLSPCITSVTLHDSILQFSWCQTATVCRLLEISKFDSMRYTFASLLDYSFYVLTIRNTSLSI